MTQKSTCFLQLMHPLDASDEENTLILWGVSVDCEVIIVWSENADCLYVKQKY